MAEAMSGTMPSPTIEDFTVIEQMREQIPASEVNETLLATAAEADPMAVAEFKAELRDLELPVEVLDVLNDMVDEILAEPERYDEIRAHYKTQDMPDDMLPETFDPEFFGALNMALDEIRATSGAQARAPQGFAMGGIASLGRNGDTMLAHVTPAEMKMLKDKGGAGTINPRTGLPEFFSLSKVFKKIGKAVKKFASSTVGKIVISTALFMTLGPAAAKALSIKSAAAKAAVSGFVAGAGSSLAAGNSFKDSLKAGAIGGISAGALQGISTKLGGPSDITEPFGTGKEAIETATTKIAVDPENLVDLTTTTTTGGGVAGVPNIPASVPSGTGFSVSDTLTPTSTGIETLSMSGATPTPNALVSGPSGFTASDVFTQSPAPLQQVPNQVASTVTEAPGFFESVKETFSPDRTLAERGTSLKEAFSPAARQATREAGKMQSIADTYYGGNLKALTQDIATNSASPAVNELVTQASASSLMNYAPLAGAGLGIMALSGGFEEPSSEVPAGFEDFMAGGGGQRLIDENPDKYRLRFGGINPLSSYYFNRPTYNAAMGSGPQGVDPNDFPRMNGPINGPGTGTSDDVPAMLSDGEFVFTAKAVRNMGDGSRRKGAKRMYAMMKKLENRANG